MATYRSENKVLGQGFHYVLFLEYISVDADDQEWQFSGF
jgi:hypothetical protein